MLMRLTKQSYGHVVGRRERFQNWHRDVWRCKRDGFFCRARQLEIDVRATVGNSGGSGELMCNCRLTTTQRVTLPQIHKRGHRPSWSFTGHMPIWQTTPKPTSSITRSYIHTYSTAETQQCFFPTGPIKMLNKESAGIGKWQSSGSGIKQAWGPVKKCKNQEQVNIN